MQRAFRADLRRMLRRAEELRYMGMLRRILCRRRRTVAPRLFSHAILPNKPDNARAVVNSPACAPTKSVRSNAATAGGPVENACLAGSGASLVPPLTLVLVLASLIFVLLTTPTSYLSFDRLQQRCFKLEALDGDLGSPME
jgi:hypothetical protein